MSMNKPSLLGDWLVVNPDLMKWDSITGVCLTAGNTALRQTHATHLSQGHEITDLSGHLEIDMSDIVYHFAGYQLSGPQVGINRASYESTRLEMVANLHGGTLVMTEGGNKVLSLSEHDALQGLELKQQASADFKNGALVLDVSKGEDMRLAVSEHDSEQLLAGDWLRQQLPVEAEKLEYPLVKGLQGQPELELRVAQLATQADAQDKGDTLVVFASSQYGSAGDLPNINGDFPRLLPDPPEPEDAVQLLSARVLHRNAFLAGFTQLLDGGRFSYRSEDGRLVEVVAEAGTLQIPPTNYESQGYIFAAKPFQIGAAGGVTATFELDLITLQWHGEATIDFSCLAKGEEVPSEFNADFALSLRHRFYLLPNIENDQGLLEGQFFSPWPEALEAHARRGLPEGDEYEELRLQAGDFAAYAVKRAILLAIAKKLNPAAPEQWMEALTIGGGHTIKFNPADLAFPGALLASGSLSHDAAFRIRDDDVNVLAGGFHEFIVDNPHNEALTWTLETLPGGPSDPGSFVDGKFRAPPAHTLQRRSGQVLVIASNEAGQRSVAVVTVLRQPLTVNPFITVMQAGTQRLLNAGVLDEASLETKPLKWTMVNPDPEYSGEKLEEDQGRRCRYMAKAADSNEEQTYWVESFEVELEEPAGKQAVHVLVTLRQPMLRVKLATAPKRDGSMQFEAYVGSNKDPVAAQWRLAVGTGQIDPDTGLYVPAQSGPQSPGIVVIASHESEGYGRFEGHLIMPSQPDRFTALCQQMLASKTRSV